MSQLKSTPMPKGNIQTGAKAATVIKFEIQVRGRLEIGCGVKPVVAAEFCSTTGDAGVAVIHVYTDWYKQLKAYSMSVTIVSLVTRARPD